MKKLLENTSSSIREAGNRVMKSAEARWAVSGGVAGSAAALALGVTGVGVAGAFGALAIPGVLLVGLPAAYIGSRIGLGIERRSAKKAADEAAIRPTDYKA